MGKPSGCYSGKSVRNGERDRSCVLGDERKTRGIQYSNEKMAEQSSRDAGQVKRSEDLLVESKDEKLAREIKENILKEFEQNLNSLTHRDKGKTKQIVKLAGEGREFSDEVIETLERKFYEKEGTPALASLAAAGKIWATYPEFYHKQMNERILK